MRFIGGIDPGLTGALAVLDFETFTAHLWDTPTVTVQVGDKKRERCDPDAYADSFEHFPLDTILIENVQSTPNDGHVGAFTFGKVTGIAIGIASALRLPMPGVAPAKWKMRLGVPKDKHDSRIRAHELFPALVPALAREKDHGRAEALMIALYHAIDLGLTPTQPFRLGLVNGKPPVLRAAKKK